MQSKEELEQWYTTQDPWQYETTQDDIVRKQKLLEILNQINNNELYNRALDIACGEGFVTTDLPAKNIYGLEISDRAAERFSKNITRVLEPEGQYDLILCTGALYSQYDHVKMSNWISQSASKHVLIAGIKDWLIKYTFGNVIYQVEFPYRQYIQKVTIYEVSA